MGQHRPQPHKLGRLLRSIPPDGHQAVTQQGCDVVLVGMRLMGVLVHCPEQKLRTHRHHCHLHRLTMVSCTLLRVTECPVNMLAAAIVPDESSKAMVCLAKPNRAATSDGAQKDLGSLLLAQCAGLGCKRSKCC